MEPTIEVTKHFIRSEQSLNFESNVRRKTNSYLHPKWMYIQNARSTLEKIGLTNCFCFSFCVTFIHSYHTNDDELSKNKDSKNKSNFAKWFNLIWLINMGKVRIYMVECIRIYTMCLYNACTCVYVHNRETYLYSHLSHVSLTQRYF